MKILISRAMMKMILADCILISVLLTHHDAYQEPFFFFSLLLSASSSSSWSSFIPFLLTWLTNLTQGRIILDHCMHSSILMPMVVDEIRYTVYKSRPESQENNILESRIPWLTSLSSSDCSKCYTIGTLGLQQNNDSISNPDLNDCLDCLLWFFPNKSLMSSIHSHSVIHFQII